MKKILISLFLLVVMQPGIAQENEQSFEEALQIHLNAIQNKDMKALAPTVADDVVLIFPNGEKLESKKAFMDFHENWFQQTDWQWKGDTLAVSGSDSLGYALVRYNYIQKDSSGNTITDNQAYLVLIFKKMEKGWQLIHDQNTSIKKE